ncbi:MAG TPA: hypothetical protein PK562_05855, partial [Candidatus Omnitrophota bacterium]|nr:hypothetical protein [Candidatus Omnitrophota bacterium]
MELARQRLIEYLTNIFWQEAKRALEIITKGFLPWHSISGILLISGLVAFGIFGPHLVGGVIISQNTGIFAAVVLAAIWPFIWMFFACIFKFTRYMYGLFGKMWRISWTFEALNTFYAVQTKALSERQIKNASRAIYWTTHYMTVLLLKDLLFRGESDKIALIMAHRPMSRGRKVYESLIQNEALLLDAMQDAVPSFGDAKAKVKSLCSMLRDMNSASLGDVRAQQIEKDFVEMRTREEFKDLVRNLSVEDFRECLKLISGLYAFLARSGLGTGELVNEGLLAACRGVASIESFRENLKGVESMVIIEGIVARFIKWQQAQYRANDTLAQVAYLKELADDLELWTRCQTGSWTHVYLKTILAHGPDNLKRAVFRIFNEQSKPEWKAYTPEQKAGFMRTLFQDNQLSSLKEWYHLNKSLDPGISEDALPPLKDGGRQQGSGTGISEILLEPGIRLQMAQVKEGDLSLMKEEFFNILAFGVFLVVTIVACFILVDNQTALLIVLGLTTGLCLLIARAQRVQLFIQRVSSFGNDLKEMRDFDEQDPASIADKEYARAVALYGRLDNDVLMRVLTQWLINGQEMKTIKIVDHPWWKMTRELKERRDWILLPRAKKETEFYYKIVTAAASEPDGREKAKLIYDMLNQIKAYPLD